METNNDQVKRGGRTKLPWNADGTIKRPPKPIKPTGLGHDYPRWEWSEEKRSELDAIIEKVGDLAAELKSLASKTPSRSGLLRIRGGLVSAQLTLDDISASGKSQSLDRDVCEFVLNGAEFDTKSVLEAKTVYEAYLHYFSLHDGDPGIFGHGAFTRRITRLFPEQVVAKVARIGDKVARCFIGLRLKTLDVCPEAENGE